jgi:hypothetical protein
MTIKEALDILSVTLPSLTVSKTLKEAQTTIDVWKKAELKYAYYARCKACHPDIGPDEEKEHREDQMKTINLAHKTLKEIEVHRNYPWWASWNSLLHLVIGGPGQ